MKKVLFIPFAALLLLAASCSTSLNTSSKNAVPFPGMTVSRADYQLSKDVTATVQVKEFTTLFKYIRSARVVGQGKNEMNEGFFMGYGLDPASRIAAYRLLENNPEFDYVTNVRIKKEYKSKWLLFFTKYESNITITAKGVTLKTDK
jgi:hypothetical protein